MIAHGKKEVTKVIKNNEKAKKKFGELLNVRLVESMNQVEDVKLKTVLKEVGWNSSED